MKRDKQTRKLFRAKLRTKLKSGVKNVGGLVLGIAPDLIPIPGVGAIIKKIPLIKNTPQSQITPVGNEGLLDALPLMRTVTAIVGLISALRDAITELLEDLGVI